ncbi:putative F-box domain, galactose oxidase/kelch, beta-propeller, F-box associated interaction [Rosa chinensis]|uniref:Putative F-box domain, galactose oxidase/kelch, beta-propeller, F-box associated interaction n=1 Tax=Rosa chinensis TaxID=74649 RepID=A0A2P6QDM4_ROSCH|nr:putative F-box domain, galactose oxidase/kelch, beta-propeller, F-box associated interaction [Rosa chinensis]
MTDNQLPEDIIVSDILVKLPIKSLIRCTCVSKRWRFLISDPEFAKSHLQLARRRHHTLTRRLLLYCSPSQVESLDLETPPSPSSPIRNLTCKLNNQPESIKLLGSCNGLVCVCTDPTLSSCDLFIWNPSTGFLRNLPYPCFSSATHTVLYGGFGYLSAADDYKVVVAADNVFDYGDNVVEVKVLSWRTGVWRKIEVHPLLSYTLYPAAVVVGETLHWFRNDRWLGSAIIGFDLDKEEFREMPPPPPSFWQRYDRDYVGCVGCWGGRLHVFRYTARVCDVMELWVRGENGDGESWTEVFKLKIADEPRKAVFLRPFLAGGSSAVVAKVTRNATMEMVRIEPRDEEPVVDMFKRGVEPAMILYEESLHRLPGCGAVEEEKVEEIQTPVFGALFWITDHWYSILALVGFLISLCYIPVK